MFPVLKTDNFILNPLNEDDFKDMFSLVSNPAVAACMESGPVTDEKICRTEFSETLSRGECYGVRLKKSQKFIGFIGIHQYLKAHGSQINFSQIWQGFLPEHWNRETYGEVLTALLHFAFTSIKTPWICVNHLRANPFDGSAAEKCGFKFYKTYKHNRGLYDQYRYTRDDYLKERELAADYNPYDFIFTFPARKKSPYSYEEPVRKIDCVTYIKEPTGYLCGQSVIAMLAGVPVEEVIEVMETDKGTSVAKIDEALVYYGIKHARTRTKVKDGAVLPELCILSLKLPGYGHWSLYYKGTYYDPEFGVSDKPPANAELKHYWKIEQ